MYSVREDTIGAAHERAVKKVLECGRDVRTEDGEETIELNEPLVIHVTCPLDDPVRSPAYQFSESALEEYADQIKTITSRRSDGQDFVYTYGNRLNDYPIIMDRLPGVTGWDGDGTGDGIDQISNIISSLAASPVSRRAIAHIWVVEKDVVSKTPPCLQTVQFIMRDKTLNCIAYFRSNDILSAWGANAYGLTALMMKVARDIRYVTKDSRIISGYLETVSVSAHIYHKRDADQLKAFKRVLNIS